MRVQPDTNHRRERRRGRDGVGDQPGDGDGDVRSDRGVEHRSGDEHGEPFLSHGRPLDIGNRKADVQRRHQQVECCESRKHARGMRALGVCVCVRACMRSWGGVNGGALRM